MPLGKCDAHEDAVVVFNAPAYAQHCPVCAVIKELESRMEESIIEAQRDHEALEEEVKALKDKVVAAHHDGGRAG